MRSEKLPDYRTPHLPPFSRVSLTCTPLCIFGRLRNIHGNCDLAIILAVVCSFPARERSFEEPSRFLTGVL